MVLDIRLKAYVMVMDAQVVIVMLEGFDHCAVLMKIKMTDRWKFRKRMEDEGKRLTIERLRGEGIREEYKQEMTEVLKGRMCLEMKRWKEYFEKWMNIKSEGKAIVMCLEMIGRRVVEREGMKREEVMKAVGNFKY